MQVTLCPEEEQKYSSTLLLNWMLNGNKWLMLCLSHFTGGKETPPHPMYRRLGGPQGQSGWVQKIFPSVGFDPWTIQPVAIGYTDYIVLKQIILCSLCFSVQCHTGVLHTHLFISDVLNNTHRKLYFSAVVPSQLQEKPAIVMSHFTSKYVVIFKQQYVRQCVLMGYPCLCICFLFQTCWCLANESLQNTQKACEKHQSKPVP